MSLHRNKSTSDNISFSAEYRCGTSTNDCSASFNDPQLESAHKKLANLLESFDCSMISSGSGGNIHGEH